MLKVFCKETGETGVQYFGEGQGHYAMENTAPAWESNQRHLGMNLFPKGAWRMRTSTILGLIRGWILGLTALYAVSITGCSTTAPMSVRYYEKEKQYIAEAQISLPVDEIYKKALQVAEERKDKNVKIVSTDEARHLIEVTDGVQTATFVAKQLDPKYSWITVMANVPGKQDLKEEKKGQQEENRDLALQIVSNLCKAIKAECTVVKLK